jgi:hypothetical protein
MSATRKLGAIKYLAKLATQRLCHDCPAAQSNDRRSHIHPASVQRDNQTDASV